MRDGEARTDGRRLLDRHHEGAGDEAHPHRGAKRIADEYGFDQIIIYARRCHDSDPPHGEHMTTYGRTKAPCDVAAQIGRFLQTKIMGWTV